MISACVWFASACPIFILATGQIGRSDLSWHSYEGSFVDWKLFPGGVFLNVIIAKWGLSPWLWQTSSSQAGHASQLVHLTDSCKQNL